MEQLDLLRSPSWADVLAKYKGVNPEHALLPDTEAALLVEQEPKTLEDWRIKGIELPFVKLGRRVRYRLADLLAYRSRTFTSTRHALSRDKRAGVEWARNDAYELLFDLIQEDSPCH
jgi:hypothetical protein